MGCICWGTFTGQLDGRGLRESQPDRPGHVFHESVEQVRRSNTDRPSGGHAVGGLARNPERITASFFQFPAWIEICRVRSPTPIPNDLASLYFSALDRLSQVAAAASQRPWDRGLLVCVLAAIAAGKGDAEMAEAILELAEDGPAAYLEWRYSQ